MGPGINREISDAGYSAVNIQTQQNEMSPRPTKDNSFNTLLRKQEEEFRNIKRSNEMIL